MNTTTPFLPDEKIEGLKIEEVPLPGITKATMKGLVYGDPGIIELKDIPTPMLLTTVTSGKLEPAKLITHHFKLN